MQISGRIGVNHRCLFSLFLLPFFFCLSCKPVENRRAVDGVCNLFSYSFLSEGPVLLSGKWNCKYEEREPSFAEIPSNWKNSTIDGFKPVSFGYAEYSLHIVLPPDSPNLTLKIGEIGTASTVFLNGVEASRNGVFARNKEVAIPAVSVVYVPVPRNLAEQNNTLDIRIQVSNFDDSNGGGIWGQMYLGTSQQIERMQNAERIRDSFMAGLFFIVALYYLVLYMYRRSDLTSLLFGLICVAFFIRQISTGEKILLLLFPSLSWRILVRLEYLSLYSMAPLYISFFNSLFPQKKSPVFRNILIGIGIAGTLCVALLSVPWFIATLHLFQLYWILLFAFTYFILILAERDKQDDAWIFLASFTVLVAAALNDMLLTRLYVPTPSLVSPAQAIFIFFQSLALSRRFAREYRQSKNIADLNIHLRELDNSRLRFFTASSHELRTPVTLIATPLEAIMSGLYGETISRNAPVFDLVKRNCDRLTHLADELLDFLRFDSGAVKPSLRLMDLCPFLKNYVALFTPDAERRGLKIVESFASASVALVDPILLETVILNLLSNAVKNTSSGGTITVSAYTSAGNVFFSVSDTGKGIAVEQLPHLFERFSAASFVSGTDYTGFGIGLPLSAEIVKTLGGHITVVSQLGEGSTFTVSFPSQSGIPLPLETPASVRVSRYIDSSPAQGKKGLFPILVVDDDPDMLSFLAEVLSLSFDVHTAPSGLEALSSIEHGLRPRVIISDVMMSVMDGFELRERIAAMDACKGVPFLFLSAKADPAVKKSGLNAGAVDYILKPFSVEELSAKISSLIALARSERERLEQKLFSALRNELSDSGSANPVVDWKERALSMGMSERDLDVLALVIRGLSDKEIAVELDCASRTVSNRVSTLLKRTNTPSRAGLIAFITRNE